MVGASKILTVSYGTFSCTLEGFDDPFSTMKAIAEYFRDLAADDRYFGAEPPTPDTEMLQRIAEREVRRRVEAKTEESGVVLRAGALTAPEAAPAPVAPAVAAPIAAATVLSVAPEPPAPDSIAAKLARIRAAVDHARQAAQVPAAETAEDSDANEDLIPTVAPVMAEPAAEEPAVEEITAEAPAEMAEADETLVDESLVDRIGATLAGVSEPSPVEPVSEPVAETAPEPEVAPEVAPRPRARVIKVRRVEPTEPGGRTVIEATEVEPEDAGVTAAAEPVAEAVAQAEPEAAEEEAPVASSLSAEAEAELQAELAEVERELGLAPDHDAEPEAAAEEAAAAESVAAEEDLYDEDDVSALPQVPGMAGDRPRLNLTERVDADEASLDRLMRQTATELDEPEARRRQATLAHLKAAVVATHAEKPGDDDAAARKEAAELDRYRDDLAQVVRPRRPVLPGSATARPTLQADRPAPLVLVSEQRVDAPARNEPLVIRPRRITSSNVLAVQAEEDEETDGDAENIFANSKSFAEFAERIGATDLPDLLEAAAAYAACVEGRPTFSRPQILRSAAEASEMPVSREQSLRSFGMLLRQGKIQKVKRGQFAIAETSRYLPEARKIAR